MAVLVECELCPRRCRLGEGQRGNCRVRVNLDGKLQTLAYGNPSSVHVDPIEKKPLFHVLPASGAFSIATAGCNLHCKYCQNWQLSQSAPEDLSHEELPPDAVVAQAIKNNCRSIAYTYSDPIIFYEYMYDTAVLAHKNGLRNLMITAGYIEQKPLVDLCPVINAANVDLKGITDDFYRRMSEATLKPVLDTIVTMHKNGVWVELTNLVVPTWNDSPDDIHKLCRWVVDTLGPDVPLHFSRFWPMHQLKNLPPTPVATLTAAWDIAKELGIHYVYMGNIPGHPGNNTYCPKCKTLLIERKGYMTNVRALADGRCTNCGAVIPGIWK